MNEERFAAYYFVEPSSRFLALVLTEARYGILAAYPATTLAP
jgi:hypothetical protein